LRKACYGDVKVITVPTPYVTNEVYAIHKAAFHGHPLIFTGRRVATKGEDISTTMFFSFLPYHENFELIQNVGLKNTHLQGNIHFFLGHVGAS
jgi:hypothetical protein